MGRTAKIVFSTLLVLAILFVPFPTSIYPAWTVRFIDESGNPVPGVRTRISCHHYTYTDEEQCNEDEFKVSDANGLVMYGGKSIVRPLAVRIVLIPIRYLLLLAHGSVGTDTYLITSDPEGYDAPPLVNFVNSSQEVVVLRVVEDPTY